MNNDLADWKKSPKIRYLIAKSFRRYKTRTQSLPIFQFIKQKQTKYTGTYLDELLDSDMVGNGCPVAGRTYGNTDVHAGIVVTA
jgi:hypothetical protein